LRTSTVTWRPRRLRPRRDERGAGGVEFLIMATALITLFTVLVQYGINLHASRVAQAAAREGAVTAARWNGTAGAGSSTAQGYLAQDGAPAVRGSTVSSSRSGTRARVTVTVQVVSILPWLDDSITSTATAPVERWVD
jgi:Flp pilus assembly protein TadG